MLRSNTRPEEDPISGYHNRHNNTDQWSYPVYSKQAIIATVSDDETWKVWSVPNCDLLMSGEGHRNWVSGVTFHPQGTMLATGAGDNTVKIWDFLQVGLRWGREAGAKGAKRTVRLWFAHYSSKDNRR